jgi:hypothetical protein
VSSEKRETRSRKQTSEAAVFFPSRPDTRYLVGEQPAAECRSVSISCSKDCVEFRDSDF